MKQTGSKLVTKVVTGRDRVSNTVRPIDYAGHVPAETEAEARLRQIVEDNPEVTDVIVAGLRTVIEQLEDLQTHALKMLADLARITGDDSIMCACCRDEIESEAV